MKQPKIAETLKYYRKKNQLSVNDVIAYLQENLNGKIYSEKTVYGWETNVSKPPVDVFLHLCKLYKIENVMETFGWSEKKVKISQSFTLTEEEMALILAFRTKKESFRNLIRNMLDLSK